MRSCNIALCFGTLSLRHGGWSRGGVSAYHASFLPKPQNLLEPEKIKGTHVEIEAACAPYGYHPLSLRLLAGRILKDFENPADIVIAQKLKIDGNIIQQKHHVLEVSYNSLPQHEQKLLSTIACFRSPVELKTLEAIKVRADGRPYRMIFTI